MTGSGYGHDGNIGFSGKMDWESEIRNSEMYADQLRYYEDYTLTDNDIRYLWNGGKGR